MSRSALKGLQAAAGAAGGAAVYVDDVFSTYLYDGNGSTQTITNGIDLSGEGGLTWIKSRTNTGFHFLFDTERGAEKALSSELSDAENSRSGSLTAFNNNGFSVGSFAASNGSGQDYASWTFRKQPGFFDVVTYSGTGSAQNISHNLGSVPGMIIVKSTTRSDGWAVYHRNLNGGTNPEQYRIFLNTTGAESQSSVFWNDTAPTSTVFTVGTEDMVNSNGDAYVAYLFAHDEQDFGTDEDESIIKCGSISTDGVGQFTDVDLGFEPQWVLVKRTDSTEDWWIYDTMRGIGAPGVSVKALRANLSNTEVSTAKIAINASGIVAYDNYHLEPNATYIYVAIRRPHKPAEEFAATDLFAVELASNTSAGGKIFPTSFPVDFTIQKQHTISSNFFVNDRMRGGRAYVKTNTTDAEANFGSVTMEFDHMDGVYSTTSFNWSPRIFYALRRASGFFDVVAYTGDGTNPRTLNHNLGVAPEMVWVKARTSTGFTDNWTVWHTFTSSGCQRNYLNTDAAKYDVVFSDTGQPIRAEPTATALTLGSNAGSNKSAVTYITYLFASVPGICDIGSFTDTGSEADIDCGFSNGARFVLIKPTDSSGSWSLFDTVRGISNSSSPRLALNKTDAQQGGTAIKPYSGGFRAALGTTITYIYMAIA